MNLDLPTLTITVAMANAVAGTAVMYVGTSSRSRRSLTSWGWALLAFAVQPLAFAWRFAGSLATSVMLSNGLMVLVLVIQWDAVARFREESESPNTERTSPRMGPGRAGVIGLPIMAATVALLLLPYDFARNSVGTLILVSMTTVLAVITYRARATSSASRGRQLLLSGTLLLTAVLGWRFLALIATKVTSADFDQIAPLHAVTYLVTIATMLLQTLGFVLWHQERAVDREHDLAEHDALTGCLNRRALFSRANALMHSLARRPRAIALLMLDLDFFKQVNDRHGHLAGDAVLRETARRLRHRLRADDLLSRFGGEEFLVILDDTDETGARVLAEDLRTAIASTPMRFAAHDIAITVSIGVHCHAAGDAPPVFDDLVAAGDATLYRAKAAGRNRVV